MLLLHKIIDGTTENLDQLFQEAMQLASAPIERSIDSEEVEHILQTIDNLRLSHDALMVIINHCQFHIDNAMRFLDVLTDLNVIETVYTLELFITAYTRILEHCSPQCLFDKI